MLSAGFKGWYRIGMVCWWRWVAAGGNGLWWAVMDRSGLQWGVFCLREPSMRWHMMCERYDIRCHSLPSLVWHCVEEGNLLELYTFFCHTKVFTTKAPHSTSKAPHPNSRYYHQEESRRSSRCDGVQWKILNNYPLSC